MKGVVRRRSGRLRAERVDMLGVVGSSGGVLRGMNDLMERSMCEVWMAESVEGCEIRSQVDIYASFPLPRPRWWKWRKLGYSSVRSTHRYLIITGDRS